MKFRNENGNKVEIRRQENCPFNLYSTAGMAAYALVSSFPKEWTPEQAANALCAAGYKKLPT